MKTPFLIAMVFMGSPTFLLCSLAASNERFSTPRVHRILVEPEKESQVDRVKEEQAPISEELVGKQEKKSRTKCCLISCAGGSVFCIALAVTTVVLLHPQPSGTHFRHNQTNHSGK